MTLLELRQRPHARHAEFSDDKGRRAAKAERLGLIVVARQDGVDRLGVGGKVAVEAIDIDAGAGKQLADPRLGRFELTPTSASWAATNLSWYLLASAIRAATTETGPRIGQSFSTRRTLPSSCTTWRSSGSSLRQYGHW